jgi:hypothetical protein
MAIPDPNAPGAAEAKAAAERRRSFPVAAAYLLATLVAFVSLLGIALPNIYQQETPNWAAQGVGQDCVDLLLAVPWLLFTGWLAARGSRRGLLLLAAAELYCVYEFAIYAFALHFNALFLAYCAALGLSFFALAATAMLLSKVDVRRWYSEGPVLRVAGGFLIAVGLLFAALWLSEVMPALLQGGTPRSIREAGLPTNPVYVLDLSIILPVHGVAGWALLKRRALGYALGPVLLGFDTLMALSIAGMLLVMRLRRLDASLGVAGFMFGLALASAGVLWLLLRRFELERKA